MFYAILITAGESLRFGSAKALGSLSSGKTVIQHLLGTLIQCPVDKIIVVTGAYHDLISTHVLNHTKVDVVYNKDYKLGQTSSVQTAVRCLPPTCRGFLLCPVDTPLYLPATVDALIDCYQQYQPDILIPTFHEKKGHPPLFSATTFQPILNLNVQHGLNTLFNKMSPVTMEINDPGIIRSFNTPEEFEEIKKTL